MENKTFGISLQSGISRRIVEVDDSGGLDQETIDLKAGAELV